VSGPALPNDRALPAPRAVGSVRNFAWLAPGLLARGEQPPLDQAAFAALKAAGVGAVLSLRADEAGARVVDGRRHPPYRAADERAVCAAAGLRFHHVPCDDFAAPPAPAVAAALRAIDEETRAGRAVFVHCLAGVGRTGVVTGAWLLAHGWRGEDVAEVFFRFADDLRRRLGVAGAERDAFFAALELPGQWWALQSIAAALGVPLPATGAPVAPRPPAGAAELAGEYQRWLRPWRHR
jgi:protein tyrosine phosphatase (PTP) superfamily phosphohydrolase (DUF442 family)